MLGQERGVSGKTGGEVSTPKSGAYNPGPIGPKGQITPGSRLIWPSTVSLPLFFSFSRFF